jgi:hypothetical protein
LASQLSSLEAPLSTESSKSSGDKSLIVVLRGPNRGKRVSTRGVKRVAVRAEWSSIPSQVEGLDDDWERMKNGAMGEGDDGREEELYSSRG